MNLIYLIPGPILVLLGGFSLSWGGLIIRSFESASIWQILFYRSLFFLWALITFLFLLGCYIKFRNDVKNEFISNYKNVTRNGIKLKLINYLKCSVIYLNF